MRTRAEISDEIKALKRLAENADEVTRASIVGQINALQWVTKFKPLPETQSKNIKTT